VIYKAANKPQSVISEQGISTGSKAELHLVEEGVQNVGMLVLILNICGITLAPSRLFIQARDSYSGKLAGMT